MSELKNQNTDLFLVTYNHTRDLFTAEEMKQLEKPFMKDELQGKINSIKQVKPLRDQKTELDSVAFELKTNATILQSLVAAAYQLDENSKDYIDALENISFFVHHNIIDLTKEKIDDLNSVLEYEETRK